MSSAERNTAGDSSSEEEEEEEGECWKCCDMSSQLQDSSSARFSGLINPIRDLALNWDVDIAHTLEDYLEELEHIRLPASVVSLGGAEGGSVQNLNFAEAALLIQGSTCVYSKKVEHLHNLVFQALELVSAQQNKEGEKKVSVIIYM